MRPKKTTNHINVAFVLIAFSLVTGSCSSDVTIGYQDAAADVSGPEECDRTTLYVEGKNLYDICGEQVIPIGVNEMVVWAVDRDGSEIFPEIRETGANTVRFAWEVGASLEELDRAIGNCISNNMIAMPSIHHRSNREIDQVL